MERIRSAVKYSSLGRVDDRSRLDGVYLKTIKNVNENVIKNRHVLNKMKFCGAFELALRGHDETDVRIIVEYFAGHLI